jgi:hypothetical protein
MTLFLGWNVQKHSFEGIKLLGKGEMEMLVHAPLTALP